MPEAESRAHHTHRPGKRSLDFAGILSEGFFSHLSSEVIAFALPLYARQLGLGLAEIGVLLSLHLSISLALKPFTGWAADRLGQWRRASVAIALRSLLAFSPPPVRPGTSMCCNPRAGWPSLCVIRRCTR
jgi:MFS family permease